MFYDNHEQGNILYKMKITNLLCGIKGNLSNGFYSLKHIFYLFFSSDDQINIFLKAF